MLQPLISEWGFKYITDRMVEEYHTRNDYQNFVDYMYGQTSPIIDDKECYYYGDYLRWFYGLPIID